MTELYVLDAYLKNQQHRPSLTVSDDTEKGPFIDPEETPYYCDGYVETPLEGHPEIHEGCTYSIFHFKIEGGTLVLPDEKEAFERLKRQIYHDDAVVGYYRPDPWTPFSPVFDLRKCVRKN